MTNFEFRLSSYLPGGAFIKVDDRFDVVIERTSEGLEIRIYPLTNGEIWDYPYDIFKIDESAIAALEEDMKE